MQYLINGLRQAQVLRIIEEYEASCSPAACRDALKVLPQANDPGAAALRIFLAELVRTRFPRGD